MLVLALLAFEWLSAAPFWRYGMAGLVVIIAVCSAVPLTGLPFFAMPYTALLPLFGGIKLIQGTSNIDRREYARAYKSRNTNWPVSPVEGRRFLYTSKEIATALNGKVTAFGARDILLNVNSVNLSQVLFGLSRSSMIQIDPIGISNEADATRWLAQGDAASACLLLMSDQARHQFPPVVPPAEIAAAAKQAGFQPTDLGWTLPDNEHLTLWRRHTAPCS